MEKKICVPSVIVNEKVEEWKMNSILHGKKENAAEKSMIWNAFALWWIVWLICLLITLGDVIIIRKLYWVYESIQIENLLIPKSIERITTKKRFLSTLDE